MLLICDGQDAIKKLKLVDEISEFTGVPPPKTNMRLAQQAAVKHFPLGLKEFSAVFTELDNYKPPQSSAPVSKDKWADDLTSWLENTHIEGESLHMHLRSEASEEPRKIDFENVTMYRCSWCGNPSASLRKCESYDLSFVK